ncbi:MAG TPA: thymidylate kinase [Thermoplasmatales archaeon]|nr:thymidylate kinase [Candidatus Thermoplasmatota archaeon]HDS58877.1 thymidylate kinase [Thermoplasmatales archaeon]
MRFIVVDGLDGAGKDTHAQLIKERYAARGETVLVRSHPTDDNRYGRRAKRALLGRGKRNHLKASVYYALDVIRSIRRYYGTADTFIVVRYLLGVAYLPLPLARVLYKLFQAFLPTSPYMFFLDVEPVESLRRLQKRQEQEMFETLEGLQTVREKALHLVEGWHIVHTNRPIEDAHAAIDAILDRLDGEQP